MRHRSPSPPLTYEERPWITNQPRIKAAVAARLKQQESDTERELRSLGDDFTDEELFHIEIKAREERDPWFNPHLYVKAWNQVRPQLLAPASGDAVDDFVEAWSQPEAEQLFDRWWNNEEIRARDAGAFEAAKAVLLVSGGMRRKQIIKDAHSAVRNTAKIEKHFRGLADRTARDSSKAEGASFRLGDYTSCTRRFNKLTRKFPMLAMETNIAIVKILAELFPHLDIGHYAAIDGTLVPYWAIQKSAKRKGEVVQRIEDRYNRNFKRIGFKAIGYDADGQYNDKDKGKKRKAKPKVCRGGLFVGIVEVVTGLPLVGVLLPASTHETHAIYDLLPKLFGFWPEMPLDALVADKLYDSRALYEYCERYFGVHLVAIRKPSLGNRETTFDTDTEKTGTLTDKASRTIGWFNGKGIGYCRRHKKALHLENPEVPDRKKLGLHPGQAAPEGAFRIHFREMPTPDPGDDQAKEDWCGRPTLKMAEDWSAFAYYPHHGLGKPTLYAKRLALISAARNQVEAAFGSLKTGFGIGVSGQTRARVGCDYTLETLIWGALTTRALTMLADQRASLDSPALAAA